jgi:hypothetical protein
MDSLPASFRNSEFDKSTAQKTVMLKLLITKMSMGFWDVTPCSSETELCFEGTNSLHLQGRRVNQARYQYKEAAVILDLRFSRRRL